MRVRKGASMLEARESSVLEDIIWAGAEDEAATEDEVATESKGKVGQPVIMPVLSDDVNPIGSGTIHGSHGLLVRIFGGGRGLAVEDLRRISLDRRFPEGYVFPGRLRRVNRGDRAGQHRRLEEIVRKASGAQSAEGGANSGEGNNGISDTPFVQAHIHNINFIICPFLSTMVNEGALPVSQSYTRVQLQAATELAGLDPAIGDAHIEGNFVNDPDAVQDIFNLEGVSNEHVTSTGIHDCSTVFTDCSGNDTPQGQRECQARTTRDCMHPSREGLFDQFVAANDRDGDGMITLAELREAALAAEAAGEQLCSVLSCPDGCVACGADMA